MYVMTYTRTKKPDLSNPSSRVRKRELIGSWHEGTAIVADKAAAKECLQYWNAQKTHKFELKDLRQVSERLPVGTFVHTGRNDGFHLKHRHWATL